MPARGWPSTPKGTFRAGRRLRGRIEGQRSWTSSPRPLLLLRMPIEIGLRGAFRAGHLPSRTNREKIGEGQPSLGNLRQPASTRWSRELNRQCISRASGPGVYHPRPNISSGGGQGRPQEEDLWGAISIARYSRPNSRLSCRASRLASRMLVEAPTVRHTRRPSVLSIHTRTRAAVPASPFRMWTR